MEDLKFSICIPTYNMGHLIGATIQDILSQDFLNYEIIISDNNSSDNTEELVRSFNDGRIKYFKNAANVGGIENYKLCIQKAQGDIIYLMTGKARLSKHALMSTYNAFNLSSDIGVVTRPYYWYGGDGTVPVRVKEQFAKDGDLPVSIHDGEKAVIAVFKTLDNPAGLAIRKKYIDQPINNDPFVAFVYPIASIFKKHKVMLLKNYVMAVPALGYSGSQDAASYEKSPLQSWVDLFNNVFYEEEFRDIRERCIRDFVAVNYVGLAQIKNYGGYKPLFREIYYLIKYRWYNVFNLKFWIFSVGSIFIPKFALKKIVVFYKTRINSRLIKNIKLGA